MNRNYTTCAIQPSEQQHCTEPANVVMFATGGPFAGRTYHRGQHILLCIRHADHIINARRGNPAAAWLIPHTTRLPLPNLPSHKAPTPTPRPRPWGTPRRERTNA